MAKYIRHSVAIAVVVGLSFAPFLPTSAQAAAPSAPKKFTTCTALLKVYKKGIASTKKAKGKSKSVVNAAVYRANKKLDVDKNGIACDKGDLLVGSGASNVASKKFTTKTFTGAESEVITLGLPAGMVAVATIDFDGADGVTVSTFDADETLIDMLVSSYGPYSGTVLLGRGGDIDEPFDVVTLDISGEGNWKVKVSAATAVPVFDRAIEGDGDAVYRYAGKDIDLAVVHQGEDAFSVRVYDKDGFLVERTVDEYGEVNDIYPMTAGAYIVVTATGQWSLAKSK
ncbi:MAG: hypothetical protein RIQ64_312 [Actinomycetota bacterium]|jgi:hypothetical protein